jgi:uncharacterized membrane protein YvbJ
MKFCTLCGNQLKPDAKFCSKCGQLVKEDVNPGTVVPTQQPLCSKCGKALVPGVKFCTACGAPSPLVTAPPPAVSPPIQPRVQAQSPPKKKGRKILVFVVSAIVLLAVAGAALYFFGIFEPKESYADPSALYEEPKVDQARVDSAATVVENVFLTADTVKLTEVLSPTTLKQKREFFSELQPHMAAFGNDFKTRKFLYATARFAVYEFSSADGTFTAEFCLGEDGKWKLMRF